MLIDSESTVIRLVVGKHGIAVAVRGMLTLSICAEPIVTVDAVVVAVNRATRGIKCGQNIVRRASIPQYGQIFLHIRLLKLLGLHTEDPAAGLVQIGLDPVDGELHVVFGVFDRLVSVALAIVLLPAIPTQLIVVAASVAQLLQTLTTK